MSLKHQVTGPAASQCPRHRENNDFNLSLLKKREADAVSPEFCCPTFNSAVFNNTLKILTIPYFMDRGIVSTPIRITVVVKSHHTIGYTARNARSNASITGVYVP